MSGKKKLTHEGSNPCYQRGIFVKSAKPDVLALHKQSSKQGLPKCFEQEGIALRRAIPPWTREKGMDSTPASVWGWISLPTIDPEANLVFATAAVAIYSSCFCRECAVIVVQSSLLQTGSGQWPRACRSPSISMALFVKAGIPFRPLSGARTFGRRTTFLSRLRGMDAEGNCDARRPRMCAIYSLQSCLGPAAEPRGAKLGKELQKAQDYSWCLR